jgi:hypothetical protein
MMEDDDEVSYPLLHVFDTHPSVTMRVLFSNDERVGNLERTTYASASILYFAVPPTSFQNPTKNEPYFLLARDTYDQSMLSVLQPVADYAFQKKRQHTMRHQCWRQHRHTGSLTDAYKLHGGNWTDLGGSRDMDSGETIYDTAARESIEESLGVVYEEEERGALADALEQGRFYARIETCNNYGAPRFMHDHHHHHHLYHEADEKKDDNNDDDGCVVERPRRVHVTFLKETPWNVDYTRAFAERRYVLQKIANRHKHIAELEEDWRRRLPAKVHLWSYGETVFGLSSDETDVIDLWQCIEIRPLSPWPTMVEEDDDIIIFQIHYVFALVDGGETPPLLREYTLSMDIATHRTLIETYVRWWEQVQQHWEHYEKEWAQSYIFKRALQVDPLRRHVTVKPEFLEKEEIRWWSMSRILDVIATDGAFVATHNQPPTIDLFRPSFLVSISAVFHMFKTEHGVAPPLRMSSAAAEQAPQRNRRFHLHHNTYVYMVSYEKGHTALQAVLKLPLPSSNLCYKCGSTKHSQNFCPLRFCTVCRDYGHSANVCSRRNSLVTNDG